MSTSFIIILLLVSLLYSAIVSFAFVKIEQRHMLHISSKLIRHQKPSARIILIGRKIMMATATQNSIDDRQHKQQTHQYRPLIIVLAGPTAVGKSDVAAQLCSPQVASDIQCGHHNIFENDINTGTHTYYRGHIISADSVQAYRGVNIGANKPTQEEMEGTPYHLVNVVDPPIISQQSNNDEEQEEDRHNQKVASYNAADWMGDARYVIEKLAGIPPNNGRDTVNVYKEDEDGDDIDNLDEEAVLRREAIDKAISISLEESNDVTKPTILPIVVGGTMMYLQWLVHGRPDAIRPTEEAVKRAADEILAYQQTSADGTTITNDDDDDDETIDEDTAKDIAAWKVASSYVSSLGSVFEQRVAKLPGRDWYRLRRLLEVAYTIASKNSVKDDNKSEKAILQQLTEKEVYTGIRSGGLSDLGYDVRCFFLCPTDRMTHFHTVDERCEQMLLRGLLQETADLYVSGSLPNDSQVTRAIGYRQTLEYLKRANAKANDSEAFMAYIDDFATATRQYAKKQMQWFRRDEEFAFVPVQIDIGKAERVAKAARIITDMCKLDLIDFKAQLSTDDDNENEEEGQCISLSAQTKMDNEKQGKTMKFFLSKRVHLTDGSDDFLTVLAKADECTRLVKSLGNEF